MINTLLKIREIRTDFILTVVSDLSYGDYATKSNSNDYHQVIKIIKNNEDWITHHNSLSNDQVIEILKSNHVGFLPTWADTYGFSLLEMQACGVPVISTNVRALPEINDDSCGWVIELDKNRFGEAKYISNTEKNELINNIENQLYDILVKILEDKSQIECKSTNCLNRIKNNHNPLKYSEKLKAIYES